MLDFIMYVLVISFVEFPVSTGVPGETILWEQIDKNIFNFFPFALCYSTFIVLC